MRIGIVSDLHFGSSYALGCIDPATQINTRLLDFVKTFDCIIDMFEQNGVNLVIIPGDIFDVRNPSTVAINVFSKCLKRTLDKGLEVLIVAGNHDITRSTDTTTIDFLEHLDLSGVSIYTKPGIKSFKDFHLITLPYRDRKQLKANSNEEAARTIKNQINELSKDLIGPKIVIGHFMVDTAPTGIDGETFSINEVVLPFNTFSEVNFVVMGHIHDGKILRSSNPPVLYAGSMEKITFGDRNSEKSTIIIDTNDLTNFKRIPTKVRDLFELDFDYSADKPYKSGITEKIIKDVSAFITKNNVKGSILRLIVKMNDSDVYHVNQDQIKDRLLDSEISCLAGLQISSTSSRQSRDESITENEDSKKAFKSFVGNLKEPDSIKKRLLKFGEQIIEEIEGK